MCLLPFLWRIPFKCRFCGGSNGGWQLQQQVSHLHEEPRIDSLVPQGSNFRFSPENDVLTALHYLFLKGSFHRRKKGGTKGCLHRKHNSKDDTSRENPKETERDVVMLLPPASWLCVRPLIPTDHMIASTNMVAQSLAVEQERNSHITV